MSRCKCQAQTRFRLANYRESDFYDKASSLEKGPRSAASKNDRVVDYANDVSPGIRLPPRQQQLRDGDSFGPSVSRRFPHERVLLNAYYIEDLKYVNRRLSIPSGLFSPPTEESTFDPRTQPTSSPAPSLLLVLTEHPPSTLLTALFFVLKSNLIDPKGEYVRSLRYRRPFRTGRPFSVRRIHHRSEIV